MCWWDSFMLLHNIFFPFFLMAKWCSVFLSMTLLFYPYVRSIFLNLVFIICILVCLRLLWKYHWLSDFINNRNFLLTVLEDWTPKIMTWVDLFCEVYFLDGDILLFPHLVEEARECYGISFRKESLTSFRGLHLHDFLVVQWLLICPPIQEVQFPSLDWEDPQRRKWQAIPVAAAKE